MADSIGIAWRHRSEYATIELTGTDGDHVVVKHSLNGSTETQSIEAETTLTIPSGDTVQRYVGFGVGEKAHFRFDDAGTDKPVAASVGLRYHYDAYGRVVGRTLDPGGTPVSQFFIYDNDRIVQELDGSGNLVAEWVYGAYIDEIYAMYRNTDGVPGFETYYYIQDDQYNVVALTDDEGTVVERYSYDDYGAPTVWVEDTGTPGTWIQHNGPSGAPESSLGNPFLFTGRRWDSELRLYDYRTRYYDPALGRFLRKDTIGLWGDPNNLGNPYAYLGNNPWSCLDPFGEGLVDGILNAICPVRMNACRKDPLPQEFVGMQIMNRKLVAGACLADEAILYGGMNPEAVATGTVMCGGVEGWKQVISGKYSTPDLVRAAGTGYVLGPVFCGNAQLGIFGKGINTTIMGYGTFTSGSELYDLATSGDASAREIAGQVFETSACLAFFSLCTVDTYAEWNPQWMCGPSADGYAYDKVNLTSWKGPDWQVGPHGEMPSPRALGYESHHGVNSVWGKAFYGGYEASDAPAVLMKSDPYHNATRGVFNIIRAEIARLQGVSQKDIDWSKVSPGEPTPIFRQVPGQIKM